jgi:hypothetical protein
VNGKAVFVAAVCALVLIVGTGAPEALGAGLASPAAQGRTVDGPQGNSGIAALPGNTFTYQGYLTDKGRPANGLYDFSFSLYADLAGTQWVANARPVGDLQVTNGLFTAPVDLTDAMYGDVHFYLNGEARYLKIGVRPGASTGAYTALAPLQELTPAPYAQALPGLHTIQNATSPNVVGGYAWNSVNVNAVGATISGGGADGTRNEVNASYGTVSGGEENTASGQHATVSGGRSNEASANYAMVPGGRDNTAAGAASFAAGNRAKANHSGTFVWADDSAADFASTSTKQFRVRATNGAEFIAGNTSYGLRGENTGGGDGVRGVADTKSASYAGVWARNNGTGSALLADSEGTYSGYFMDNIYVSGNCVGCTMVYVALNDGDQPLEAGDLAVVGGVDGPLAGAEAPVLRVRRAGPGDTVAGVVESRAAIATSEREGETLESAEKTAGAAAPGDYLFIVVSGVAEVKVDASEGPIAPGQRLAAADQAGHARALRSRMLDGMEVAEGAPQVGIALAFLESGAGRIPVLVTLR